MWKNPCLVLELNRNLQFSDIIKEIQQIKFKGNIGDIFKLPNGTGEFRFTNQLREFIRDYLRNITEILSELITLEVMNSTTH